MAELLNKNFIFNDEVSLEDISFDNPLDLDFISNDEDIYTVFSISDGKILYNTTEVYREADGWVSPEFKLIKITGGDGALSDEFEEWIYANATYQEPTEEKEYLNRRGLDTFWAKLKSWFQVILISGVNIKTINSESILGSGNIEILEGVQDVLLDGASTVGGDKISRLNGLATEDWVNDQGFVKDTVNNLLNYYLKTETYNQDEVNDLIGSILHARLEVVTALPSTPETQVIYLIETSTPNVYEQHVWATDHWITLGSTEVDLTQYLKTDDAEATYQKLSNASRTLGPSSTHDTYPTSKTVYDYGMRLLGMMSCPYGLGDLYITTSSTDPSTKWEGTSWEKIDADAYLKIVPSGAGNLGGTSDTHQIPLASMPSHNHGSVYIVAGGRWVYHASGSVHGSAWVENVNFDRSYPAKGSNLNFGAATFTFNASHQHDFNGNDNPYYPYYLGVYVWKRTA